MASPPEYSFRPLAPSAIRRKRSPALANHSHLQRALPVAVQDDQLSGLTTGWTRIRHPDFGSYYFHEEMVSATVCSNMNNEMSALHGVITQLLRNLKERAPPDADSEMTIVLDLIPFVDGVDSGQRPTFGYYFASHTHKRVFWLEDFNLACLSEECDGPMESSSRCKLNATSNRKHCELFPNTLNVTEVVIRELKSILVQVSTDRLTSRFSTSPYTAENVSTMLELANNIEPLGKSMDGRSAWTIAKFMMLYHIGILRSSYGQNDDYFDIEYSESNSEPYQRSMLMALLSPLMLKSAEVYAEELHSFRDNFSLARWRKFVDKVDISIRDSNLLATVLLSTSIGFLAIGSVDSRGADGSRSAVQIVIYCSVICSIGSIIIGLIIFKQYRAKGADTPLRAIIVLKRILSERYGPERLAVICSLPYILLMWSLILFSIAVFETTFNKTDVQTRTPVAVAISLLSLSVFGSLYTAGPRDKEEKVVDPPEVSSWRMIGRQITGFIPAACKQLRKPARNDLVQCAGKQGDGDMETGLKTC
ncbi:uncharacterized protein EDB93DRAFT_1147000 [Suillus bovinus]|uniref:uncharacterized protein n=1 Tax=Suillus bovinus TaxID=48563 RepID=UPI001B873F25|nr:uncharacterized protein EDB93DRAFT_1147000 [Suillus bovinus]KAG2147399.1 hypothetical protein EDB93DRAFT_1147000 [Suillus bovinus]